MKNLITLILIALFSSCATKKYGCGLTHKTGSIIEYNHNASGTVCKFDSLESIHTILIRVDGVVYREGNPTETKFILVYGDFSSVLENYIGKRIKFQFKAVKQDKEVIHIVGGCIDEELAKN